MYVNKYVFHNNNNNNNCNNIMPNRYCCYIINLFYLIWVSIGWSFILVFNFNMTLSRNNYILNRVVYNGFAYFHHFKKHITNENFLEYVYFLLKLCVLCTSSDNNKNIYLYCILKL